MKRTKKFFALALLLSALITVGCGSSGEQEAAAETAAAGATETIGAGTGENTELDIPEAPVSLGEALVITAAKMETEPGRNKVYVDIENITGDEVCLKWTDLTVDGQASSEDAGSKFQYWFPDEWSRKIKAGDTSQEIFYIDHPTEPYIEYAEMAIEAIVSDSGETQTEPLKVTVHLKDIETVDITDTLEAEEKETVASAEVYAEKQELYSKDGAVITLTKMEVDNKYGGVCLYLELTNNGEPSPMLYLEELYVGDTLLEKGDFDLTYVESAYELYISNEEKVKLIKEELPEISVVFEYRAEAGGDFLQTPRLTFPVLRK